MIEWPFKRHGRSRARRRLLAAAAVASSLLQGAVSAAPAPAMTAGNQLNDATFDDRISSGLWMVEHWSPFCKHCKRFAPTWIELVEATKGWETRGLHLGQVDCAAQGDLCSRLDVKYYPFLRLYQDGNHSDIYDGDRELKPLVSFLDKRSAEYMSHNPLPQPPPPRPDSAPKTEVDAEAEASVRPLEFQDQLNRDGGAGLRIPQAPEKATGDAPRTREEVGRAVPGSEGQVIKLTKDTWKRYATAGPDVGPTFIKYYAPWCGHCKALAPTWNDLAHLLRGIANVAELNCDDPENKPICRAEEIRGFPTLYFYQEESRVEYRGSRSLTQMEAFAKKAAAAHGVRDISSSELQQVMHDDEVFFLLLYTPTTPKDHVTVIHDVARSSLGSVIVFKSDSPALFERFSLPRDEASLLVFKDYDDQPYNHLQIPSSAATADLRTQVRRWMRNEKHPLLPELTGDNFDELLTNPANRNLLVLGAISAEKSGSGEAKRLQEQMKAFAKRWRESNEARRVGTHVQWLWINSDAPASASYLKNTYRHKASEKPSALILDPYNAEYYDHDAHGRSFGLSADVLYTALGDIEHGRLNAKSSRTFAEKISHSFDVIAVRLTGFIARHYFLFALIVVASFVGLVRLLIWATDSPEPSVRLTDRGQRNGFTYRPPAAKAD